MRMAKKIKCSGVALSLLSFVSFSHAQEGLGQVIEQTKQLKLRQLSPGAQSKSPQDEVLLPPPPPPTLWSISGINDRLVAEIWQADNIYRLPLEKGVKLPSGWQVVSFTSQSITFKQGGKQLKLTAANRGSTGWEYPQTPRLSNGSGQSASSAVVSPAARSAASNLPASAMPQGASTSSSPPPQALR